MVDMWLETTLSKNHKADVIVDWRPKTTTQHCIVDTPVPAKVQGTQASHVSWPRGPIKEEVEYVSGTSAFEVSVRTEAQDAYSLLGEYCLSLAECHLSARLTRH